MISVCPLSSTPHRGHPNGGRHTADEPTSVGGGAGAGAPPPVIQERKVAWLPDETEQDHRLAWLDCKALHDGIGWQLRCNHSSIKPKHLLEKRDRFLVSEIKGTLDHLACDCALSPTRLGLIRVPKRLLHIAALKRVEKQVSVAEYRVVAYASR